MTKTIRKGLFAIALLVLGVTYSSHALAAKTLVLRESGGSVDTTTGIFTCELWTNGGVEGGTSVKWGQARWSHNPDGTYKVELHKLISGIYGSFYLLALRMDSVVFHGLSLEESPFSMFAPNNTIMLGAIENVPVTGFLVGSTSYASYTKGYYRCLSENFVDADGNFIPGKCRNCLWILADNTLTYY